MSHYDGTKLLSTKDINGLEPEIFMCTSNRSAGKTTYFNRLCVNRWKANRSKFTTVFRYNYELDDCADKFFKDIGTLFFPDLHMTSERRASGIYHELFINDIPCGYAVALNQADALKRYSHLLSDTDRMVFDEFQSETNHYCTDEVKKFISVHTSIARGQGQQYRRVPVYMISNPVTLLNPYYVQLGISTRLKKETKFLKGDGWVLEQGFNESASEAQKAGAFNRAFANNSYVAYSTEGIYLNDNYAFIDQPAGDGRYLATIKYGNKEYGIREYADQGIIYCSDRPDTTYPYKIAITTDEHNINYVMLKRNDTFIKQLRYYFEKGAFRFKTLDCKEAIFKFLSL